MGNHWTQEDEDNFERAHIEATRARVNRKGTNVTEETKTKKKRGPTKDGMAQLIDLRDKQALKVTALRDKAASKRVEFEALEKERDNALSVLNAFNTAINAQEKSAMIDAAPVPSTGTRSKQA